MVGADAGNTSNPDQAAAYALNQPINTTSYVAVALAKETLTFDYKYLSFDEFGTQFDPAGELLNGLQTQLSVNLPEHAPGVISDPQFGSITFNLNAGDTYGFFVSTDSVDGPGTITFNLASSSVPSAAPEPAEWALLLAGFAGVGAALRRRRFAVTV